MWREGRNKAGAEEPPQDMSRPTKDPRNTSVACGWTSTIANVRLQLVAKPSLSPPRRHPNRCVHLHRLIEQLTRTTAPERTWLAKMLAIAAKGPVKAGGTAPRASAPVTSIDAPPIPLSAQSLDNAKTCVE